MQASCRVLGLSEVRKIEARYLLSKDGGKLSKNAAYGSYTRLPTSVMVKVLVLAGEADESRPTVKEAAHEAHTLGVNGGPDDGCDAYSHGHACPGKGSSG